MRIPRVGYAALFLSFVFANVHFGCGATRSEGTSGGGRSSAAASGTAGVSTSGSPFGGLGGSSGAVLGGSGASAASTSGATPSMAKGVFQTPDCSGCAPLPTTASACAGAPAIQLVYPNDGVLLPPNMNVISVQWTPFGAPFQRFELDFTNKITDVRVSTNCSTQTSDTGTPPQSSGGCEAILDSLVWSTLVNANRGGDPVNITVRGTTDGNCATVSSNSVRISFAEEDLLGALFYWKSTVSASGVGGQIWEKSFGDVTSAETEVTNALQGTCNGCHALSREGSRMVVYSDDNDSDDEYGDVTGKLLDTTTTPPKLLAGGTGKDTGQPPGFSTISPLAAYYLTSNGIPDTTRAPANGLTLWNGQTGGFVGPITVGAAGTRPTMPDWSSDGRTVIYVTPSANANWNGNTDDAHIFGGSLYTIPYTGNATFGSPSLFLQSGGENNYYPSFSPDGQLIVFDRAARATNVNAIDGCTGTAPRVTCPNDSFSNPAARMMVAKNAPTASPVDLEAANGSPVGSPIPLSNSWPKWSPFVQKYRGRELLWIAFSSTRDYGIRVRNHKAGMFQCYPPDSEEDPNGSHGQSFDPACQQPQIWMAAVDVSGAEGNTSDPSKPAFWLPFQDITTHNHTPQWTQRVATQPPPAVCVPLAGDCRLNPCCNGIACNNGTCQQAFVVPR